jgi:hypothetical protein
MKSNKSLILMSEALCARSLKTKLLSEGKIFMGFGSDSESKLNLLAHEICLNRFLLQTRKSDLSLFSLELEGSHRGLMLRHANIIRFCRSTQHKSNLGQLTTVEINLVSR